MGETRVLMGGLVAELPVEDVVRAQEHYRDVFGFEIGWIEPDQGIGAVSGGGVVIFFRRRERPFEPGVHWVFCEDVDGAFAGVVAAGGRVVDPLEMKSWGIRQFTVEDLDGNLFYFHG